MTRCSISPQYITRDKINVTILDMIDPAHFVVKESPDLTNASSKARNFLEAEAAMQKYYASVDPGFFQLPLKDAIIVVLYQEKFYRARVIRILTLSAGHLFKVYLVDYGIECSVPRQNIYEIEKDFLDHPFQAVTFELLGIEPISLVMDKITLTVTYGPVLEWDPSVPIYFKDLQKSMCSAYIEVQGIDDCQLYGKLFLCFESNPTKCINDELISHSFARFNENCWKNIKTIESILKDSNENSDSSGAQPKISRNENLKQVPITFPEMESDDGDIKMMFINPVDGKIVAESTLTQKSCTEAGDIPVMLQNEMVPAKEIVPELHKSEVKSSSHFTETTSETEVQLMTQKHLQKLLNKKKRKSPIKPSCNESTNNETSQTFANNIAKDPAVSCENSPTNVKIVVNEILNQNESKDETSKNEEKEKCSSISQAQLIAEKRLMKLQLKRKSLSPSKCTDKVEIPHNHLSDTFPDGNCLSETPNETLNETPKEIKVQENESEKQLQKLQKKVRLKHERMKEMQKKESLQMLQKSSNEFNQDEVNINTSCDSSLYDSDSGLNSFSSSSSTSDRGWWCSLS